MARPRSPRPAAADTATLHAHLLGFEPTLLADDARHYVAANDAACELLGRPISSVLALTVDDLAPAEARPWVADAWAQFIVDGTQAGSMVIDRPDGSVRHVEFSAEANVAPGIHRSVLRDVSDRVTAEIALRSAQEELALQRSRADRTETQLLLALGQIPTVVWSQDLDLRFTYVSQFRHGLPSEMIGRTDQEVWPLASDADRLDTLKRRVLATGSRVDEELVLTYPDGPRICQISIAPLFDVDGRPFGITGATTDVTLLREAERREAEAEKARAVQEREALYRGLIESLDTVTWVTDTTEDADVYMSPQVERILGYPASRWAEPGFWRTTVHPEDLPAVVALNTSGTDAAECEYRAIAADGRIVWFLERWRSFPESNGGGRRRLGISLDITARKEAEARLADAEARYRRIIESQEAFFWEEELPAHVIRYISPQAEAMTGYGTDRWMAEPWFWRSLIHPDDKARVIAAYESQPDGPLEYRFVRADGGVTWVREHGTVIADETGRPIRLMGVVFDITALRAADEERRMLEERLNEVARLESLARVAATTAHDFGNVLLGIDVFSKHLAVEPGLSDKGRTDVARIRSAVEQGRNAANALVSLGRLADPELVRTDVHAAIRGLELSLAGLLGPRIDLRLDLRAADPVVELDPGALERSLINMALNARDAMGGGRGRLSIATSEVEEDESMPTAVGIAYPGRYLSIAISDTGEGMDARTMARAFEPYFTTKPVGKGTGLGLSSVHALVRAPDGHIHASSEPGRGTSFRVCLPSLPTGERRARPARPGNPRARRRPDASPAAAVDPAVTRAET